VSTTPSSLLDDPIENTTQDALGRGAFASSIAALIDNAPQTGSIRFGVFGEWGEGKTSVMRMIAADLRGRGHVTVPFSPWDVKDLAQAWDLFLRNLDQQLSFSRTPYVISRLLHRLAGQSGSLAEISDSTKPLKAFVAPAVSLTEAASSGARKLALREARAALGSRRLTVFVDDLDRVAPGLAPQLLMSLRETFSVPGFHYVLGLSPSVITEGLRQGGYTGALSAEQFLEKIIEYPHYLPPMMEEGSRRLIQLAVAAAPGAIRADTLDTIARYLPANPRRLKLFLRHLISLREHIERLSEDEMNWPLLYACVLLRLEFPASAQGLGNDEVALKALGSRAILKAVAKQEGETLPKDRADELYLPNNASAHARYHELCKAVAAHCWNLRRYELRQVMQFVDAPPVFTWKEANEFFSRACDKAAKEQQEMVRVGIGEADRHAEAGRAIALFMILLDLRDAMLDHATDATTSEAARPHLENAHKCAGLLRVMAVDLRGFASQELNEECWIKLFGHASKWARIFRDPIYSQARADERVLLAESAKALADNVATRIGEEFFARAHAPRTPDTSKEFQDLTQAIQTECEARAARGLVAAFELTDALESNSSSQLYDPRSAFHTAPMRALLAKVASRASTDAAVQENCYAYLGSLLGGAFEAGSGLVATDCLELLQDESLLSMLWRAATARPLALRSIGSLLYGRHAAKTHGVNVKAMPIPGSWEAYGAAFPEDALTNSELAG
jgi:hypothetical protein